MFNELEYLAGIFDAEGFVNLRSYGKGRLLATRAAIQMQDEYPLDILVRKYGCNKTIMKRATTKDIHYIEFKKHEQLLVLRDLLPYLNEKRLIAQAVVNYLELDKESKIAQSELHERLIKDAWRKHPPSIMLSKSYIGGMMDGDGYFGVTIPKREGINGLTYKVGLEQCYPGVINELHRLYGGSVYNRKAKKKEHRDSSAWALSSSDQVMYFLHDIREYVKIKVSNIDKLLQIQKFKDIKTQEIEMVNTNYRAKLETLGIKE
jgi:hypothetical protein